MENAANLVSTALTDVGTIFTQATSMITGNALAMCFVGISLAGAGIGLFKRVIRIR